MISEDYQQRRSSRASLPTCHHRGTYCRAYYLHPMWTEAGLSAFLSRVFMAIVHHEVEISYGPGPVSLPPQSHFISIERAQTSCRMCVCVFANSIEVSLYLVPNSGGTGKRLVRHPRPPPTSAPLPDDFDAITFTRDSTAI